MDLKYKVGQRVRIVGLPDHIIDHDPTLEGAAVEISDTDGDLSDPYSFTFNNNLYRCEEKYIKPLTTSIKWL